MVNSIGRTERVSFPDLKIGRRAAKIDTGAYNTAIHVDFERVENDVLIFGINGKIFEWEKFKKINVKSSFGDSQDRFLIKINIKMGSDVYQTYVSLSDRKNMRYSVLIGRRFLSENEFIVDVNKRNINAKKN